MQREIGDEDLHALARLVVDEGVGEGPVVPATRGIRHRNKRATCSQPLLHMCNVLHPDPIQMMRVAVDGMSARHVDDEGHVNYPRHFVGMSASTGARPPSWL